MFSSLILILFIFFIANNNIYALKFTSLGHRLARSTITKLHDIPMELTGQLDPNTKWNVKLIYRGEERIINISEDTSVLEAAEKLWDDAPSSCRNGVCTTCAGRVSLMIFIYICIKILYIVHIYVIEYVD
jgi:ferredoxin